MTSAALVLLFSSFALAACAEEKRPAIVVAALGDSTTAGNPFFRSPVERPPRGEGDPRGAYGHWIEKLHPDWKVANLGVGGHRADQVRARLDSALRLRPDYLVVLAGVNDVYQGRSASSVIADLDAIYAGAGKARVVACTVLPYEGLTPQKSRAIAEINAWIRARAAERGHLFCDTRAAVEDPAVPDALAGTPDGLHPDIAGYRKMGEAIAGVIEEDLRRYPKKS